MYGETSFSKKRKKKKKCYQMSLPLWVENTVHEVVIHFLVKKDSWLQRSVKKVMLTVSWDKKSK